MLGFELSSVSRILLYSAALIIARILYVVCYRLVFHPLAGIPGPKLAAVTFLYQTYFSFAHGSRFYEQIGKLHTKYGKKASFRAWRTGFANVNLAPAGPVVRITPDEIHLSDAENCDTIYHVGSKYAKYPRFYDATGLPYSAFATCPNDMHRLRRGALNPFFSRKMVLQLEEIVQDKAEKLCAIVSRKLSVGEAADLHHGFRAVSIDVITDYAFDRCYNLLDSPDLGVHFFTMIRRTGPSFWILQQWPELQVLKMVPPWILKKMSPPLAHVLTLQEV
jgi:hypothetical protein